MVRGEFRMANGLIIPNNITTWGAAQILALAFPNTDLDFYVGLCSGVYEPDLQIEDLTEPTIGVGGYARQLLDRTNTDWPAVGELNGEPYAESKELTWTPTGADYDEEITRMFIASTLNGVSGNVFALSGALPAGIILAEDEPLSLKYRIYLR